MSGEIMSGDNISQKSDTEELKHVLTDQDGPQPENEEEKPRTPLPWKKLLPAVGLYFCEAVTVEMLFPFVAFLVRDFKITDDEDKLGYYAGWIVSSFLLGQFASSFLWGFIGDRIGRRPVLLLGLLSNCCLLVLFGLSKNIYWAIISRSLNGLMNGNMGVIQTYIREVTDESNQVRAFSLTGVAWGIGQSVGPAIGGYLSLPVKQYPSTFKKGTVWETYPYFLPCLVVSCMSLVLFVVGLFVLEESLVKQPNGTLKRKSTRDRVGDDNDENTPLLGNDRSGRSERTEKKERERLISSNSVEDILTHRRRKESVSLMSIECIEEYTHHAIEDSDDSLNMEICYDDDDHNELERQESSKNDHPSLFKTLTSPNVLLLCFLMFLFAYTQTSSNEIFPLWARRKVEDGGINFSPSDISTCVTVMGVALLIYTSFIFPPMVRKMGVVTLFQLGIGLCIFIMTALPFMHDVRVHLLETKVQNVVFWVAMLFLFLLRAAAMPCCFASLSIMLQNSTQYHLGAVNGMFSSVTSLSMAFAPTISGSILAYTTSHHEFVFPFDYHFAFLLNGLICGLCLGVSFFLPKSLTRRCENVEEEKTSSEEN